MEMNDRPIRRVFILGTFVLVVGIIGCQNGDRMQFEECFGQADKMLITHRFIDEQKLQALRAADPNRRVQLDEIRHVMTVTSDDKDEIVRLGESISIVGTPPGRPLAFARYTIVLTASNETIITLRVYPGGERERDMLFATKADQSRGSGYYVEREFLSTLEEVFQRANSDRRNSH